jgi:hypothetical protein
MWSFALAVESLQIAEELTGNRLDGNVSRVLAI